MASAGRCTKWRQGHVLSRNDAISLGVLAADCDERCLAVVVSHDCDLAAAPDKEPMAEVIPGRQVAGNKGLTRGKVARRLHLAYKCGQGSAFVELQAPAKRQVPQEELRWLDPCQEWQLGEEGLRILQSWLAIRYQRAAWPEAFGARLNAVSMHKGVEVIMEEYGEHVVALLAKILGDPQAELAERIPYRMELAILYASSEADALEQAEATCVALQRLFREGGRHIGIELEDCTVESDEDLTVAERGQYQEWNLEYLSFQEDSA